MQQNLKTLQNILSQVHFNVFGVKLNFRVMEKGDGFLLQVEAMLPDNVYPDKLTLQRGGKYYISAHAINDEVVLTAWKACQDFVIHEAREAFLYKEATLFHPHYSVDALAEFCINSPHVSRQDDRIKDHARKIFTASDIDH